VELSLKDEMKATKIDMCRYGADGKAQKTLVVEPPPRGKEAGPAGQNRRQEDRRDEGRARERRGAHPSSAILRYAVPMSLASSTIRSRRWSKRWSKRLAAPETRKCDHQSQQSEHRSVNGGEARRVALRRAELPGTQAHARFHR
jgi:hypothetical protein